MILFPNPRNCPWLGLYNEICREVKGMEEYYKEYKKTQPKRNDVLNSYDRNNVGIHHIIPKKIDMSLVKDPENLLYVPFDKHLLLHYYLWKSDYHYAPHLRFLAAAARSWNICELPEDGLWEQIVRDCERTRKEKNNSGD